jgi:HPt (histidine-containing phosphotransfer) domain-containing protein
MSTGDPELDRIIAELRAAFRVRTAQEIPLIERHYAALKAGIVPRSEAAALRRIVHQMGGSAGSFGFPALSEAAIPLDDAIGFALDQSDAELVEAAKGWDALVDRLLVACRAIQEGNEP